MTEGASAEVKEPKRDNTVTNDLVAITVTSSSAKSNGTERRTFLVHKQHICKASPFFQHKFMGKFLEGKTQSITLNDVDPDHFANIINWVYAKSFRFFRGEYEQTFAKIGAYPKLSDMTGIWKLADRFIMPSLQILIINSIAEKFDTYQKHCRIYSKEIPELQSYRECFKEVMKDFEDQFVTFLQSLDEDLKCLENLRKLAILCLEKCCNVEFFRKAFMIADKEIQLKLLIILKEDRKSECQGEKLDVRNLYP